MRQRKIFKAVRWDGECPVFRAVPGAFNPRFGTDDKRAREIYRDIANCPKCKFGMVPETMCRLHRTQAER